MTPWEFINVSIERAERTLVLLQEEAAQLAQLPNDDEIAALGSRNTELQEVWTKHLALLRTFRAKRQ
jgi:hypothetical protein